MMVVLLKHVGTIDCCKERLKISAKTTANSDAQALSTILVQVLQIYTRSDYGHCITRIYLVVVVTEVVLHPIAFDWIKKLEIN